MITSKQRAKLKAIANKTEAVFQLGKGGVSPEFVKSVSDALEKRELVKISVLNNCVIEPREAADIISGRTTSDVVQVIGKKITLFRKSDKNPVISSDL